VGATLFFFFLLPSSVLPVCLEEEIGVCVWRRRLVCVLGGGDWCVFLEEEIGVCVFGGGD
jgi:hypothetical protein